MWRNSRGSHSRRIKTPCAQGRRVAVPWMPRSRRSQSGREVPSVEWRQKYSLLFGLERLLADEEPKLVDGTVLSAHQVDALSGTLTALIAEAERQNGNGAVALPELEDLDEEDDEPDEDEPDEDEDEDDEEADDEPQAWDDTEVSENGAGSLRRGRAAARATGGPRRCAPFLVRARNRCRQDRRRPWLRRRLADRRHADPHPPSQPRRPVPRRAARPRLLEPHLSAAAGRPGPRATGRSRSRPTSGSCATPATCRTRTRS